MIHIACNIDANFIQHCAVTLVSLFENNKRADICVHIVAPYLSEADQAILRNLAAPYGNEVCFYYPPKDLLQCFSIKKFGKRISMATYYRCMFSSILPESLEKVLYLDCDIVILGDISEFWNTDLSGCGAACVEDIGKDEDERYERLHYDKRSHCDYSHCVRFRLSFNHRIHHLFLPLQKPEGQIPPGGTSISQRTTAA